MKTIELSEEEEEDQDATVLIVHCDSVPGQALSGPIKKSYCQVLGKIVDRDVHGLLRIQAVKIVNLDLLPNADVLKLMWPGEVEEQMLYLDHRRRHELK